MTEVEKRTGPVIEYFEVEGTRFVDATFQFYHPTVYLTVFDM